MTADAIVMKRTGIAQRHAKKIALCTFRRLADRLRNLTGRAVAEAHAALPVADDDECSEAEALTALDDLRNAIDVHELIGKLAIAFLAVSATLSLGSTCHDLVPLEYLLKLQTTFAGGIGERLDAPVK